MEPWRRVFRDGIAPQLPLPALEALRAGLLHNDPRLRPGLTIDAGGFGVVQACAIGYGAWKGVGLRTPAEVECFFNDVCNRADELLGRPGACAPFITWFDGHRREFVFPLLLTEVNRAIACRAAGETSEPEELPAPMAVPDEEP